MAEASNKTLKKQSETVNIEKSFVDDAPVGLHLDATLKGFRLKVTEGADGKLIKVYLVCAKVKGGTAVDDGTVSHAPVKVTIGRHGDVYADTLDDGRILNYALTAVTARSLAARIKSRMTAGTNPNQIRNDAKKAEQKSRKEADQAEKVEQARLEGLRKAAEAEKRINGITLRKAFQDYLAERRKVKKVRESTEYTYTRNFEKEFAGWLDKPLREITDQDVADMHDRVSTTGGLNGNGRPGQANLIMRILRAVEEYKEGSQPVIERNPVKRLSKKDQWNKLKPRENALRDYQFKAFFEACISLNHSAASDYFQFLVLTGLRREEGASLPWSQVNFASREFVVKDTKNGRDHHLPLTEYLYSMLKSRRKSSTSKYVFPLTNNTDGYMSDYRIQVGRVAEHCREILAASDSEDIRSEADNFKFMPHDLSRTFGTVGSRLMPGYIVKALLNHRDSNDVTQEHYSHNQVEALREPLQTINDHMLKCAGITEYCASFSSTARKVVRLDGARARKFDQGK